MSPENSVLRPPSSALRLQFTHAGQERTLAKHPRIANQLRHGQITEAAARETPWYLRAKLAGMTREQTFKLVRADKAAIAAARDILNGHKENFQEFSAWMAARAARRGVTIGQLAQDWFAADCPFSASKIRRRDAAQTVRDDVTRALRWWNDQRVAGIRRKTMEDFAVWRRQNTRAGYDGNRSIDLELSALSCLCQWAVASERIESNPFEERDRYQDSTTVQHCVERSPENDEQLHRILAWFFAQNDPIYTVGGAWLAFTALTGLRPEEPQFLFRYPQLNQVPSNSEKLPFGTIFPNVAGEWKMRVFRTKRSRTNPYVLLHPAARDFLEHWQSWLETHHPVTINNTTPAPLFPDPAHPDKPLPTRNGQLSDRLARCCVALKLPPLIPKGTGRAYYVKVRRAQGRTDPEIGVELGQSGNGELVRNDYGNPEQEFGSQAHDWLPATKDQHGHTILTPAAWTVLKTDQPQNIIQVRFT